MSLSALEKRVARLEQIIEISRSLNATHVLRPLLSQIIEAGRELTDSAASSIMLVDRKTGELHFEAATGERSDEIRSFVVPMEGSVAGWVVQHEKPLIVADAPNDPRFYRQMDAQIDFTTHSLLAVPLAVKGKVIGVLEAVNKRDGGAFDEEDVETLSILADQAAVAIENAILFEQSDLVSEIVHEMRTPLASIAGYAHLIMREDLPVEQHAEFARTIHQEAMRLSQMAGSFLDLARLESGRAFLARQPVAMQALIAKALTVIRPQSEARQIALTADLPEELPTVTGDPGRLEQTLINLISNAVKYCRPGDRVTVTARADGQEMTVGVVDTGPGIPPEAQARLFQKFYRIPTTEGVVEGSGLGLAICRQIVEAHGGRIWVESEVGRGTAFYFTIPMETR